MQSRYQLWPFVKLEDGSYSMPDLLIERIWEKMLEDGRSQITFYGGSVDVVGEFMAYLKDPKNHFVFVVDAENKEIVFMAWLNGIQRTSAFCHFCGIGKNKYRPEMSKLILDYWKSTGVPIVLLGVTPENNPLAVRLARNLGFKFIGTIPDLCYIAATGETVGGMVSYYNFKEVHDGQ